MMMLIEVLAEQKAQSEGRSKTCKEDFIWAQKNIESFDKFESQLGLSLQGSEIVFDDELKFSR